LLPCGWFAKVTTPLRPVGATLMPLTLTATCDSDNA